MYKKSLILVSVILFALFIFSGFVSAADNVKNGVSDAVNTVVNGVNAMGADVRNGIGDAENGIKGALKIDGNQNNNNMANNRNNGYDATRTATDALAGNNTSTLWIWLIVAVAAIVIIGLVWYYGAQNTTHHDE